MTEGVGGVDGFYATRAAHGGSHTLDSSCYGQSYGDCGILGRQDLANAIVLFFNEKVRFRRWIAGNRVYPFSSGQSTLRMLNVPWS